MHDLLFGSFLFCWSAKSPFSFPLHWLALHLYQFFSRHNNFFFCPVFIVGYFSHRGRRQIWRFAGDLKTCIFTRRAKVSFINLFTRSFYAHRSQKRKKLLDLTVFFALLGSAQVKAARKLLVKLTPGDNGPFCLNCRNGRDKWKKVGLKLILTGLSYWPGANLIKRLGAYLGA